MLPKAQGISLSSEFTDKLKTLQPNDVIPVWVDIEAWVDRFNDTYLPADPALYGIRWIMITFAPDVSARNRDIWEIDDKKSLKGRNIVDRFGKGFWLCLSLRGRLLVSTIRSGFILFC